MLGGNRNKNYYNKYYSKEEINRKIERNEVCKGKLQHKNKEWFIINNFDEKIYIKTDKERNRSLKGDTVIVEKYSDNKSGRVVYIEKQEHKDKTFEGKLIKDQKNNKTLIFRPDDRDVPQIRILINNIPSEILCVFLCSEKNKYLAKITEWGESYKNPLGKLIKCVNNNNKYSINSKFKNSYYYEEYYSKEKVNNGLNEKKYFKGKLSIKDEFKETNSTVKIDNTDDIIYIKSEKDRNRGLNGDEVFIELLNNDNDEETGKIVYIEKPSYKDKEIKGRMSIGKNENDNETLYLIPRDKKLPRININIKTIPNNILNINDLKNNKEKYKKINFITKIKQWNENDRVPVGDLIKIDSFFEKYYSKKFVDENIEKKKLFKGKVEILPNNNFECNVILDHTKEKIIIEDKKYLNRAMDGDNVVVEIMNNDNSTENKKGKIVYLNYDECFYNKSELRGTINYFPNKNLIEFYPVDKRIPKINIPSEDIPKEIIDLNQFNENSDIKNNYFLAKVTEYNYLYYNPKGLLIKKLEEEINNDNNNINNENWYYEKYITEEEVEKGLNDGTLLEGQIRISDNSTDSYVTVLGMESDIRITSVKFRNRALDRETVIIKILEGKEKESAESSIQRKKDENKLKDEESYLLLGTKGVKLNNYIKKRGN
ncbi:hypothetical protein PIROE2DRAFT_15295 [Piromyces sp. E2]|nr:hypothetical protein PIROE2DRAFT_15295 [Piromyces sp. E2]|eukprot:OUM59230.1 hypothetical protein PIROE2DRAFT_15295 [Piromyces sp. E2]